MLPQNYFPHCATERKRKEKASELTVEADDEVVEVSIRARDC